MPMDYLRVPEDVDEILKKANPHNNYIPFEFLYRKSCDEAVKNYGITMDGLKAARKSGHITPDEFKRAREIVRGQLPTAGMTERTTIMNLGSFANYQRKRNSAHVQPEIAQVADMMLEQVEAANVCPITIALLKARKWRLLARRCGAGRATGAGLSRFTRVADDRSRSRPRSVDCTSAAACAGSPSPRGAGGLTYSGKL
jgi:thymidylate synthase ThyX